MQLKKLLYSILFISLTGSITAAELTQAEKIIQDTNSGRYKGYKVSASSETLTIERFGIKNTYPMPEDRFYLAAAPYIKDTHP